MCVCDKQVEPKRLSLEAANQQLSAAQDRLRSVQHKISVFEEALVKLTAEFKQATEAKMRSQAGFTFNTN